jgi:hypothetical protein
MANEKHLLITVQGDYTDSSLAAETWQVGVRAILNFGTVDDVGTLPNNWDPAANSINRTETDWTIIGNWDVNGPLAATFAPDDYLNDQVAPAVDTWMGAANRSSQCRVRSIKLSPIGTNGHLVPAPPYASGTPLVLTWTGNYPVGSSGGGILPLQITPVASHRTNQVGRAGRGRMYLPGPSTGIMNDHGHIDTTPQSNLLAAQIALLEGLSFDGVLNTAKVRPVVTGGNYTRYGVITQVRVGDVVDTQRRRRRQLQETYVSDTPSY